MQKLSFDAFEVQEVQVPSEVTHYLKGGIKCEDVGRVMEYLLEHNPEQADAIMNTFSSEESGGQGYKLQCEE